MFRLPPVWKQRLRYYSWALDATVLLSLAGLILYTVAKHEPWADEAQAWLLARDFPFLKLVVSELRYEGQPVLWFAILSVAIHAFHLPYAYFGYLAGSLALCGLAVLVFLAPFPRLLRYLIAFSFFFVYQYAVIARPYVLMPLLGFLAAHFYRKGLPRITAFAVTIALLIHLSSYAALIAFALTVFYAIQLLPRWKELSADDRRRAIFAGALVAFSAILIVVILLPPPDSTLAAGALHKTLERHLQRVAEGLVGAFANSAFVAVPLLILAGIWAHQRGGLLLLVLGVGGPALAYGFLQGYGHHQGLITVGFVVFLWATWPSPEQLEALSRNSRWLHQATLAGVLLMFAWHCTWSHGAIRADWAGPYSGALDAAQYLKSVGADKLGCNGYSFWAVGVQPYFDHNIFLNYGRADSPASYHFSSEFEERMNAISEPAVRNGPPFIVVADENPESMLAIARFLRYQNYALVHYSDGTRFFKDARGTRAPYFIFERIDFALSARRQ